MVIANYGFLEHPLCVPQDSLECLGMMNWEGMDSIDSMFSTPWESEKERLEQPEKDKTERKSFTDVSNNQANHMSLLTRLDDESNLAAEKSQTKILKTKNIAARSLSKCKIDFLNSTQSGRDAKIWEKRCGHKDARIWERRCSHCDAIKTPQWRTGPFGRNTLCNACGIRFKAGKLYPEYRPADSPTFDVSKHSNVHKEIMKMRNHRS